MFTYSKDEFDKAYGRLSGGAAQNTLDFNAVILGGVQLYWEHNYNTGYLEKALRVARLYKGLRVNAVRSFLAAMTGVKIPKRPSAKPLKKGALTEMPEVLEALTDWLDWVDKEAAEPTYDHKAFVLSLEKYLERQRDTAAEHGDNSTAEVIASMVKMAQSAEA